VNEHYGDGEYLAAEARRALDALRRGHNHTADAILATALRDVTGESAAQVAVIAGDDPDWDMRVYLGDPA
jgi:hypothetical protein